MKCSVVGYLNNTKVPRGKSFFSFNVMDDADEAQQNMVSNLPLLFANGYPTSLEKITEAQLENFIPFMVQCSLGHINLQGKVDYSEPEWWPENVPFTIPIVKPKKFNGNWLEKMREIVIICYQFHKCFFLLKFCNELATYEPARLRFINNYNSTTSLYDRRSNKLLVTFRNENMSYDQPQRNRKCLLLQKSRSQVTERQQMVEPVLFDIYLCDNCDAELYSLEAITEHEKTCTANDDVIICDSPSPTSSPLTIDLSENPNDELRQAFLLNFQLQSLNSSSTSPSKAKAIIHRNLISNTKEDNEPTKLEKLKRLPRRNRGVYALSRCPTIPLSSPAGQLMIKNTKTVMTEEYLHERLDRMERFCHAPVLTPCILRPKFLEKKFSALHMPCTFKKPPGYHYHTYIPPRRQFSNAQRLEAFMFLNSLLIKGCRPISIRLKRLKENDIKRLKISHNSTKSKRENTPGVQKSSDSQIVIDTIDLCSSDEEDLKTTTHTHHIAPDVTLTPVSRELDKSLEEIRKRNKFEGNFLLSQAIANQPKPLQPSVFLFSNYTTESVHFHRFPSPNNNSPQITEISFQNQENLENSIKKSSEEWSLSQNGKSDRNSKVYHLMSFMDNDVGISKISSPNRTISIDLTS